jgi:YD repeat-containing protein
MSPNEVLDLVDALEGEVNNGVFHQYFYNSAGNKTAETIQALEIIGAVEDGQHCQESRREVPERSAAEEPF